MESNLCTLNFKILNNNPIELGKYDIQKFDKFSMKFQSSLELLEYFSKNHEDKEKRSLLFKVLDLIDDREIYLTNSFYLEYKNRNQIKYLDLLYKKDRNFEVLLNYYNVKNLFDNDLQFSIFIKDIKQKNDGTFLYNDFSYKEYNNVLNAGYQSKRDVYVTLKEHIIRIQPKIVKDIKEQSINPKKSESKQLTLDDCKKFMLF